MIEARGLRKSFGAFEAVRGIDVEVQRDDRIRRRETTPEFDQDEDVTSLRVFVRDELKLPRDFALAFSLAFALFSE